ncbi:zinc ribbon domain-containing protein [Haloterrigena alkaliphila]|uniref:Zinc ribbon domain-containing protein n=1 Tax=Haloterrigena alkaliphila TaxID=2816475 RepID=A0A8A2VGA8_9EURY|nr:zinc ribbon domain-containing protein [Haloterrigena alkaliphila]QSW99382.1 zinc ribbon domain-containing protein [Haloterrigena alkaliphila]
MSMFERLGEKVERFKQEAVDAREESAEFSCRNCDTGIHHERETCPECGSSEIERVSTDPESESERDAESE